MSYNPFGNTCRHGVQYKVKEKGKFQVEGRCEACCTPEFRKEHESEYERWHPIFSTDLSKGPDQAIEKIRMLMSEARGELFDMGQSYAGFRQELKDVEGLLTCGISTLYHTLVKMQEFKKKNEQQEKANEISKVLVR